MDYLDFTVEISGTAYEYEVRAESPFLAPTESAFQLPYDERELEAVLDRVELAVLKGSGRRRTLQTAHLDIVREFGSNLFESLISGDVEEAYYDAYRRASEQRKGLRIRLTTAPAELAGLPWELLYDPRQRDFVCLSSSTPLVRHLRSANPAPPLGVTAPLRVLGMVSSPKDLHPLDVAGEQERIQATLEPLVSRNLVEIGWVKGGTWRALQDAMFDGPWHVFHYIGHGAFDRNRGESVLAFESEAAGGYRAVSPAELGRLIERDHSLRLVVLNACEGARGDEQDALSSTAAHLVYRSVPAVLAMQWEISDDAAVEFARTFYRSISEGSAVDAAVADARLAVSMAVVDSLEWATPVLYMRTPDGVLFEFDSMANSDHQSGDERDGSRTSREGFPKDDGWTMTDSKQETAAEENRSLAAFEVAKTLAENKQWESALAALDEVYASEVDPGEIASLRNAIIFASGRAAKEEDRSTKGQETSKAAPPRDEAAAPGVGKKPLGGRLMKVLLWVLVLIAAVVIVALVIDDRQRIPSEIFTEITPEPVRTPEMPATRIEALVGDWALIGWDEAPSPITLGMAPVGGELQVAEDGTATWRLQIDDLYWEEVGPPAFVTCSGRIPLEGDLQASLTGEEDYTSNMASGRNSIAASFCGGGISAGDHPFTITYAPGSAPTRLEMENEFGRFNWQRS